MKAGPERRLTGLRNVAIFGRSVTFVLQNLRSQTPGFDHWYAPRVEQMKADTLMKYFIELRNSIEKKGDDLARANLDLIQFSTDDVATLGPRPPGAIGVFFGDTAGGSGWRIENAPGMTEPYYVELPPEIGRTWATLADTPKEHGDDPVDLCDRYIAKLEKLVADAEGEFGLVQPPPQGRRR
jgi:hypothetical protein